MRHSSPEYSATDLIALVDELIAAYVSWRSACSAARSSYDLWCTCDRHDTSTAFAVFVAALDREEEAAGTYRRLLEQVTTLEAARSGRPPRPDLTAVPGSAGMASWGARGIAERLGL